MNKKSFWILVAVMAAMSVGGCGSDDDGDESGDGGSEDIALETNSLSKPQYVKRVNSVCKKAGDQFQVEYTAFIKGESDDTSERLSLPAKLFDNVLDPRFTKLIDEISALGAPKGDEKEVDAFVNTLQDELDTARADPGKALKQITPFPETIKLANSYGLTECSDTMGA